MSELKDPRVFFAAERTLLAWNRTSLALIAFGFVVERTGLILSVMKEVPVSQGSEKLTFWIGLAFIALGMFAGYVSSRQYLLVLASLNAMEIPAGYRPKMALVLNLVVGLLGAVLGLALLIARP